MKDYKEALISAVGENWEQVVLLENETNLIKGASVECFEYFYTREN